jgi:hypothetical protein
MTIRELIRILQMHPGDTKVTFFIDCGAVTTPEPLRSTQIRVQTVGYRDGSYYWIVEGDSGYSMDSFTNIENVLILDFSEMN